MMRVKYSKRCVPGCVAWDYATLKRNRRMFWRIHFDRSTRHLSLWAQVRDFMPL
jgi:hypothetical protein